MRPWIKLSVSAVILLSAFVHAQQSPPERAAGQFSSTTIPFQQTPVPSPQPFFYRDLDLLRRDGFSQAASASVALRVLNKAGTTTPNLRDSDFTLFVNGTVRPSRLHAPLASDEPVVMPEVLLVFPPNDPVVHHIGVKQAEQYFGQQTAETLPWNVGLFDSNKKLFPFTRDRAQLLQNLDEVEHARQPLQFQSYAPWSGCFRENGSWLDEAEKAIILMQRSNHPKVVLAMNPVAGSLYGLNDVVLAHCGPESLVDVSSQIGAHIYIANVGGPETLEPSGDISAPYTSQLFTYFNQIAAMNSFAYNNSLVMQSAEETHGGFANSLNELATQIHRDFDGNYALEFDLTPQDQDKGVPQVDVKSVKSQLKVAVLDVVPILSAPAAESVAASKRITDVMMKAARHPISSQDFRIAQHVDYFPMRSGMEPLLPMSGIVTWTGTGPAPTQLFVIESVQDLDLSMMILEHQILAQWDGDSLSWERDGKLRPGKYEWRIAVQDESGKILSFAKQKISIGFPENSDVDFSSLILARSCRTEGAPTTGLRKRSSRPTPAGELYLEIDPMRAVDCRVMPDATGEFFSNDKLRAFVRIYPSERLSKRGPENWAAKFILRSTSGVVETERAIPFAMDSGSGYLASIQWRLNAIRPGKHTLDVETWGPGIHGYRRQSRAISILPNYNPQ
jgi:hypothetical protein